MEWGCCQMHVSRKGWRVTLDRRKGSCFWQYFLGEAQKCFFLTGSPACAHAGGPVFLSKPSAVSSCHLSSPLPGVPWTLNFNDIPSSVISSLILHTSQLACRLSTRGPQYTHCPHFTVSLSTSGHQLWLFMRKTRPQARQF